MKEQVNFYIDGFNFYHRIKKYQEVKGVCYKWLDYKSLCSSFLRANQELNQIYFFTAVTEYFGEGSNERHKKYILALESRGIEIIRGFFKKKKTYKKVENLTTKVQIESVDLEEKQTDVNLASFIIEGAFTNQYDTAFLLSGDSDLIPAIEVVKRNFNNKTLGFVTPPYEGQDTPSNPLRIQGVNGLRKISDFQKNLEFKHLQNHLLPEKIFDPKGELIVQTPDEYRRL